MQWKRGEGGGESGRGEKQHSEEKEGKRKI